MSYTPQAVTAELRLHLNERTTGCPAASLAAIRALSAEDIGRYPEDADGVRAVERRFDVPRGWVKLVNGLDEGIAVVTQHAAVSARLDFEAVIVEPTFEMYRACVEAMNGRVRTVTSDADFQWRVDEVIGALTARTRLVFLCSPNNPTGLPLPEGAVEQIAAAAAESTIFVDEAYAEFAGSTFIGPALDRYRNVVVGRTFSKAYGLAGLRVGAIVGHPSTLAALQPFLLPYRVNAAALVALMSALDAADSVDEYVAECAASRRRLQSFCAAHGLDFVPSAANFMLVRLGPDVSAIADRLLAEGVAIRDRSDVPGCDGYARITTGWLRDTERCLSVLEEGLAPRPR